MTARLCPTTVYVRKTELVPVEKCGPSCGYFCKAGPNCNQARIGQGFKRIPAQLPESGFPEFCHLIVSGEPGELFEETP